MNVIFLVTAKKKETLEFALRWFGVRVARVYRSFEEVGTSVPELPVAIGFLADKVNGSVATLKNLSKSEIIHVHVGARKVRKATGADSFYHVGEQSLFFTAMGLEEVWMRTRNKGKDGGRTIRVPN